MKRYLFLAFFSLWLSFLSQAHAGDLKAERTILPGGFTVITKEVHYHPIVSVDLVVRAGSAFEEQEKNGISHFYEHMFFKGTPRRSALEMKSEVELLGGELNGATFKDYTHYFITIPSPYCSNAVDLLLDAFLHPTFDATEMEKERKVVLEEINLNAQSQDRIVTELFYRSIYKVHPYRLSVSGDPKTVSSIMREDLMAYKSRFYHPSNAALVIVGDFKTATVLKQIQDAMKEVPPPHAERSTFDPPIFPKEPEAKDVTRIEQETPSEQATLLVGYLAPGLDSPQDILAMDVLTFLVGQGRFSLLNQELKEKRNLVWSVSADFLTQKFPSTFEVIASLKQENLQGAEEAIFQLLREVKEGKISPQEIERAKTLLEGVYTLGNETDEGKGSTLGFYEAAGNFPFVLHYIESIRKVTKEQVVAVARKYLKDNQTVVILRPKKKS